MTVTYSVYVDNKEDPIFISSNLKDSYLKAIEHLSKDLEIPALADVSKNLSHKKIVSYVFPGDKPVQITCVRTV